MRHKHLKNYLPHPIRDKKLETKILQPFVQVGCYLFVFPPRLFQPLDKDKGSVSNPND